GDEAARGGDRRGRRQRVVGRRERGRTRGERGRGAYGEGYRRAERLGHGGEAERTHGDGAETTRDAGSRRPEMECVDLAGPLQIASTHEPADSGAVRLVTLRDV